MRRLAACFLLLLAMAAQADHKISGPLNVEANKIVRLVADGAGPDDLIFWDVDREDLVDVDESTPPRLFHFTGPPGTYRVKARVIPVKDGKISGPASTQRATVVIGGPGPGPGPGPDPPKPPTPVAGLRAMIVYDATAKATMPAPQQLILTAKELRDYLQAKTSKTPDGKRTLWAIWPDGADASAEAAELQALYSRKRASLPWLVIADGAGNVVSEGPLPASVPDTMAALKKWGN